MALNGVSRVSVCFRREIRTLKTVANVDYSERKKEESNFFSPNFKHPYKHLFPWRTLTEFVDELEENVVFNDKKIVAINKPWGVGIHKPDLFVDKKRSHVLLSEKIGSSKFCIADASDILAKRLRLPQLRLTKAIDRHMSGIILFTTCPKTEKRVTKALNRASSLRFPFCTYWCITKGYPLISGPTQEKVGIKLIEIDEFGDYKEPQIVVDYKKRDVKDKLLKPISCEISIKSLNKQLSAAVVEVSTTSNQHHFIRTYITFKTSFILGDTRMAARVKEVLGVPIQVSPYNIGYYDDYEPLPKLIRSKLFVASNKQIPIMIHRQRITLSQYNRDKSDLIIESNQLPKYFSWTLDQLNLC